MSGCQGRCNSQWHGLHTELRVGTTQTGARCGCVSECTSCSRQSPSDHPGLGMFDALPSLWLGSVIAGCQTHDQEAVGLTPNQVTIRWFLLGWVTACGQ